MKTRLNLTIDEQLLQQAKQYAAAKKSSVSDLVETYFRTFTQVPVRRSVIDLIEELPKPTVPEGDLTKRYMEDHGKKHGS